MPSSQASHSSKHQSRPPKPRQLFDIDNYLNPFIPRNPLFLLPTWLSYWFGYRPPLKAAGPVPLHQHRFQTLTVWLSVFTGAFCGLAIIENVFLALPPLSGHAVPIIIASFGAAAILEYNTIESPLSQPRNLVLGHLFSATVAVGITKLFALLPSNRFEDLRWLAGALAVGAASVVMSITKTVHPPAGATALLAATNIEIQVLGWWLLPLVLLAAMLMLASALVSNNLAGRRFPIYWWTPVDLKALRVERQQERQAQQQQGANLDLDPEKATDLTTSTTNSSQRESEASDSDTKAGGGSSSDLRKMETRSTRLTHTVSYSSASRVPRRLSSDSEEKLDRRLSRTLSPTAAGAPASRGTAGAQRQDWNAQMAGVGGGPEEEDARIIITRDQILVPDWLELNDYEDEILRILMERLRDG